MQLTASSAGAVDHEAYVADFLILQLKGVEETGRRDDGGAVLVVVHHGDVALLFKTTLDFEALGSLDVLEVDAAECRCYRFHHLDEFFGVFLIDFDIEAVDTGKYLEQQAFALHHRFAGESAYIA